MNTIQVEYPLKWTNYELIDSGNGEKLEKISDYVIARPDPRVLWNKLAPKNIWDTADAVYIRSTAQVGHWNIKRPPPLNWKLQYSDIVFTLRPTEFKHIGVFPEQAVNWQWITNIIKNYELRIKNKRLKILNLFAYTGGTTMAAAGSGAEVTHVDSVKSSIDWAHTNVKASGLSRRPIRWIVEDAYKFVTREVKRGAMYDGIIMDPPRFGRGTKGEVWKIEKDVPKMLDALKNLFSPGFQFFLLNAYTADLSPLALENSLKDIVPPLGEIERGELALEETYGKRLVPSGIFARWSRG